MSALEEIDALVGIGRRAPGSDAERRSARHLADRLTRLGRPAQIEPFEAWPHWPLAYALCAALSALGSALSVSFPRAGAALALAAIVLVIVDAGLLIPVARRALGRRASQNVISPSARQRPGLLVLLAHYDAGRGGIALGARARRRRAAVEPFIGPFQLLVWSQFAVLACCLLRLGGVEGAALSAVQFVPTLGLIVAVGLLLEATLSGTRAGENDNASGVALALRLTEHLGTGRLEHFDVETLFTGAGKALAGGMRSHLLRHSAELPPERTVLLNLDGVGSGPVRYAVKEGPLIGLKAHPQLRELCDVIAEDDDHAGAIVTRSMSDAYAARLRGYPAITITCRHEVGYVDQRVEPQAIRRAEAFCAELIARLDAEVGPRLAARVSSTA